MNITYEQLRERIPSLAAYDSDNKEIDRYKTFLKSAERWTKRNITGNDLFNDIMSPAEVVAPAETPIYLVEAQEHIINIICYKGFPNAIPFLDLIDTGSGFAVANNQNLAPASKERVKALKDECIEQFSQSLEDFLFFLENTEDLHDAWKGSETYTLLTETFLPTLTEFRRYGTFEGTRLEFLKALPKFKEVINHYIVPIISREVVEEIIEQLRDEEVSEHNAKILEFIKLGYAAYASDKETIGKANITRAQSYMLANIETFTTFANSELYAAITARVTNTDSQILSTIL